MLNELLADLHHLRRGPCPETRCEEGAMRGRGEGGKEGRREGGKERRREGAKEGRRALSLLPSFPRTTSLYLLSSPSLELPHCPPFPQTTALSLIRSNYCTIHPHIVIIIIMRAHRIRVSHLRLPLLDVPSRAGNDGEDH